MRPEVLSRFVSCLFMSENPLSSSVPKHLLTNIAISMLSLGALAYVTECPDVLFSKAALIVENDNLVVFE